MNIENYDNVQLIRNLAYTAGLTQKTLSEKLEKYPSNFSKLIHKNNLKVVDLQEICKLLGYEIIIKKK